MSVVTFMTIALPLTLVLLAAAMTIRIVPEFQRLAIFRLGRVVGAKGPGLVLLIPLVDRPVRVDLRERFFDVPPQSCITRDNAHVSIDFLVYMKIVDPVPSVVNVVDFVGAARGIAITTLRAVVGDMLFDEVLAQREHINQLLRGKLDEVTNRWGIKITAIEIREINPPRDILEAMLRQMSAERSRRAMVLEAEGKREATVNVAQGQRQAAILEAEGNRQASILRAEGYAASLEKISAIARGLDNRTMSLQYLDTLRALGTGPATKLVVPAEFVMLLRPFLERAERAGDGQPRPERSSSPSATG